MSAFTHGGAETTGAINTAISNNRKPTADSTAYTLYKPHGNKSNPRTKFSSGGSIDGTNP